MQRRFAQIDVFGEAAYEGNPVAVVLDADGLSDDEMQRLAGWTNLSETTFVLPATDPAADYQVRIFTPSIELPFAGHPTLGTCHAWTEAGGKAGAQRIVQQCRAGLVPLTRREGRLAFAAPALRRFGPVDEPLVARLAGLLGLGRGEVVDAHWVDNGPGWVALLLSDVESLLRVKPTGIDLAVGLAAPYPPDAGPAFEVRAFFPNNDGVFEDPVTGSLNAGLAQWFFETGRAAAPYVAAQGTALGRQGRVHVDRDPDGTIWVGGATVTCVAGTLEL